ncbi:hypothetical protein AB6A40_004416 [Gnathostoma spinigerum]|uniref:Uncharacterized protein n=1 Tax=Gnathostoma spinigerum TaxID=75299 RepID=A0ABD6EMB3_9BILA
MKKQWTLRINNAYDYRTVPHFENLSVEMNPSILESILFSSPALKLFVNYISCVSAEHDNKAEVQLPANIPRLEHWRRHKDTAVNPHLKSKVLGTLFSASICLANLANVLVASRISFRFK